MLYSVLVSQMMWKTSIGVYIFVRFPFKQQQKSSDYNLISITVCLDTLTSSQELQPRGNDSPAMLHPLKPQQPSPCILPEPSPGDSPSSSKMLAQDTSSGPSPASSIEMTADHNTESLDSEQEQDGIFLDFSHHCLEDSMESRDAERQSDAWHTYRPTWTAL